MSKFDFTSVPSRKGTSCVKWDYKAPVPVEGDVIPMWVADMDFKAMPGVREALAGRLEQGVFGYTIVPEEYYSSVIGWFSSRHGWDITREQILYTTGVVPGISAVIKALASPGDKVVVLTPVYNCFFSSIRNNGCQVSECPLVQESLTEDSFSYSIDFDDLEEKCADPSAKILLLCNPHNPAGRVWSEAELRSISEICAANGVIPVSDEIHCEIVAPGHEYVPFATVCDTDWVALTSPSKSFNLAGLQMANVISNNPQWLRKIDKAININEVCDVNYFAPYAMMAAYTQEGEEWLDEMNAVVHANFLSLKDALSALDPAFPLACLEGTYLAWVDCSALDMPSAEIENSLLANEKVRVNAGTMYGTDGFIRINLATPPALAQEGIARIAAGLKRLSHEE
ncbi:MAG: pyridoxal phosphate-dependent aminotransferase [Bacteroidales bacterium]|nr:pyridoxal phosphate-dependent aminotransferase [Bacteroidales bacterium]